MTTPNHEYHDTNGLFKAGNPGGGRPKGSRSLHLGKQSDRTLHKWIENGIKRGDYRIVKLALEYGYVKPRQLMDIISNDGGMFSTAEQRRLLLEALSGNGTYNTQRTDEGSNEGSVPDPTAHSTVREDGIESIQGQ